MKKSLLEDHYGRPLADLRPDRAQLSDVGIYLWTINGAGRYVGKFTHRRRLRAYTSNVYRMLQCQKHHGAGFRTVHRALAKAFVDRRRITLSIIPPNPLDPQEETLSQREQRLIAKLGCLNDPPLNSEIMSCCCGLLPKGTPCFHGASTRPLWDTERDAIPSD